MSTPKLGKRVVSNEACLRSCAKLDTLTVLKYARAKLLRRIIDKSRLSLPSQVMLSALVMEDFPLLVQAVAEGRRVRITGGTPSRHLLRGVVLYEHGRPEEARQAFSLAASFGAAWFGYALLEPPGDERTRALNRAFELHPSLADERALAIFLPPSASSLPPTPRRRQSSSRSTLHRTICGGVHKKTTGSA